MESGKYYTPEIEEFHVGFEYEALIDYYKNEYKTFIVDINDLIQRMETYNYMDMEYIRVKYLDKEDIESLGFIYILDRNMSENYGYKFSKFINDKTVTLSFWYVKQDFNRGYRIKIDVNEYKVIFDGYLKNLSELKQVLKFLQLDEK